MVCNDHWTTLKTPSMHTAVTQTSQKHSLGKTICKWLEMMKLLGKPTTTKTPHLLYIWCKYKLKEQLKCSDTNIQFIQTTSDTSVTTALCFINLLVWTDLASLWTPPQLQEWKWVCCVFYDVITLKRENHLFSRINWSFKLRTVT